MKKAVLMILGSTISVQVGSAFAKELFPTTGPLAMVWLRLTMGALILVIAVRPKLKGHTRSDWLVLLGYAAVLVTMNATFYQAVARIPLGLAVTIEFLGPLTVAIVRSRGLRDLLWVGLAALGVVILGGSPTYLTWAGVGFALAAAACWAVYILLAQSAGRRWKGAEPVAVGNVVGAVVLATPALVLHWQVFTHWWVWAAGVGVGLLSSALPYVLEMAALRRLDQRVFSIMMSIEPAMGALSALVILGEFLTWTDLAAMACIIAASVGTAWTAGRGRPGTPAQPDPSGSPDPAG